MFSSSLRAVLIAIFSVITLITILLFVSYFYLSHLVFPPYQVYFICLAISLSNFGLYSVLLQFKWSCQYLYRRFHYVNSLLQQLIFDQPLSHYCVVLETKVLNSRNSIKDYGLWNPFAEPPSKLAFIDHLPNRLNQFSFATAKHTTRTIPIQDKNHRATSAVSKTIFNFRNMTLVEKM